MSNLPTLSPAGKRDRCVGLITLPLTRADCLGILGASVSWISMGLCRPVTGWLYFKHKIWDYSLRLFGLSHWGRNMSWEYSRMGSWGRYSALRGTTGDDCITRSCTICRPHQILFVASNQDERKEHAARIGREWRCIQGFGEEIWGKETTCRT